MSKKLVVFDMDGTILDTLDDLRDSMNAALTAFDYPVRTKEEIRRFVGNGIRKLVERAVPEHTDEFIIEKVFQTFRAYYQLHCVDKTKPYTGILDLMRQLKQEGYLIAVVSNKADDAVQNLCKNFFPSMVDCAIGERAGIPKKPSPDMVHLALNTLGVHPEKAVYVGDSEVDVETAINSQLDCIAVTWGFRDRELLRTRGATVFADTPREIFDLLQNM